MPVYPKADTATERAVMVLQISASGLSALEPLLLQTSIPRDRRERPEDVHDADFALLLVEIDDGVAIVDDVVLSMLE
jgi:hypothetical protein